MCSYPCLHTLGCNEGIRLFIALYVHKMSPITRNEMWYILVTYYSTAYINEVAIYVIGANDTRDFMQFHTRFVIW